MKKMLHIIVLCFFASYLNAQTPGISIFYEQTSGDNRNYIEYIPGNLPIIISSPHGGVKQSGQTIGGVFYPDNDSSLPDRTCGTNERDDNTDILIREIQKEIFAITGCYAHVIINNLHRSKLDPNRDLNEATCGNANAADHWNAFHNFIDQASASVETTWGKGLYIDLHGQSHAVPRIEAGYNITANELNTANLNTSNIINKSTIRNLVNNNLNNLSHEELIRGNTSLGELFQNATGTFYASLNHPGCGQNGTNGYRAVPSATNNGGDTCDDTRPNGNAYFDGDFYNNRRHGSGSGTNTGTGGAGTIDGIMTEVNRRVRDLGTYNGQVYDTRPPTLVPFAKDYAAVLLAFVNTHYNDFAAFNFLAASYTINTPDMSPIISGVPNGTFTATNGLIINPATGEIDIANSGVGSYTITYSVGACGYFQSSTTISIVNDTSSDLEAPSTPTSLVASNITETATDLSWTVSIDNLSLAGYNIYQNDVLVQTALQTNAVVTGLSPNTNYTFTITAIDNAGNESAQSNAQSITTLANVIISYCDSQSSNANDEHIGRVQFEDIDNTSGASFYSDFTNISTELVKNGQHIITITPTWGGTVYAEGYAVWIDYNQNGNFSDAGELVWSQSATTQTPVSGMFVVPTAVPNGLTRMRVSMKYNGIPQPCEAFTYGEVEDYTVNIVSTPPDTIPPVIILNGDNPVDVYLNDVYVDAGAIALDTVDGDLTDVIEVTGTVNTAVAGTYTLFYNVRDTIGNQAEEITRTVNVIVPVDATAPMITLNGSATIDLNVGEIYTELGATATDNIDGNLTSNINITGTVNTASAGTYTIRYNVSDAAGNVATEITRTINVIADTIAPMITLNGSATIDLNVGEVYTELGATATDNIDGNLTSNINITGTVNTASAGTYTIRYNVSDTAGNVATEITRTITVQAVSLGCANGINTFPYSEGFENTLGAWTQSTIDDIDWTIDANGTPSGNTGPANAIQGNFYLFVEASGDGAGYPDKQAIVTSPCFDLTTLDAATFSFNYHMFGTDMGTLAVDISDDNGTSWTQVWMQTGNQGNAWQNADIDLASYVGNNVQLRFNRITGSTWQADIAIDNIRLIDEEITVESCAGGINTFPYTQGFENTLGDWTQSAADDINWTVDANGTPSSGTGPTTATQGNFYIFVEASGNGTRYPNKQAIINSPCYDLSNEANATFSFSYHMFGANDMGTIALEASNDNGLSWTSLWSETGNKGNQWLTAEIDLNRYVGGSVQLRFNRVTGGTWQADVAIDDINLNASLMARGVATSPIKDHVTTVVAEEIPNENTLTVYPNPVKGSVMNIKLDYGTITSYRILNAYGQEVSKGKATSQILVRNLRSGVYFVEVFNGETTFTKKFMKH